MNESLGNREAEGDAASRRDLGRMARNIDVVKKGSLYKGSDVDRGVDHVAMYADMGACHYRPRYEAPPQSTR